MLKYLFIFALFGAVGFILEFTYKSITNKQIINPGLLTGPYVTIYGFGVVLLDIICDLISSINSNYKIIIIFILSTLLLTLLEYIAGNVLLKSNIIFWDYTNNKYNYKGIICLEFSFIWCLLSGIFYYFIYPWLDNFTVIFISNNIGLFLLGIYYGILIIDVFVSINLLIRLSKYSKKINKVINVEKLKKELLKNNSNIMDKIYPYICINKFLKEK